MTDDMMRYFLHPAMLLALAAAAIPLIIEWIFRRRRRQVELPTLRYLLGNAARKKVQRQDRLLLIVRCTVPAVLAAALARPLLSPQGSSAARRHVVLLMDQTVSMGQQVGVATAMALAKNKAVRLLGLLPPGTEVTLVTAGAHVERPLQRDRDLYAARERVNALKTSDGSVSMAQAVALVEECLGPPQDDETRELYVFSDFQRSTWLRKGPDGADAAAIVRRLESTASVCLVDVGGQRPFNYYLTEFRPVEGLLVTGQTARFDVAVAARGLAPTDDPRATLTFLVDGQAQGMQEVPLKAGSATARFEHRFQGPGEYLLEVHVEGDGHRVDNRRYYLASVPAARNVLILDEHSGGPGGEAAMLAAAIAPREEPGLDRASIFAAKVVHPADIIRENLSGYACVIVLGLERVGEDLVRKLEPYVRDGGSAVFFLGPRTNCWEYAQKLYRDGAGVLPVRPEAWTPAPDARPLELKLSGDYPGFAYFAGQAAFGKAEATGWMALEGSSPKAGAETVGSFSTGAPAAVEATVGAGRVLVFATAAAPPEATLPYPVLPQELLRHLAGNPDAAVNLENGQTFRQDVMVSSQHLVLRKPDGTKVRLTPAPKGSSEALAVAFEGTDQKGLYEIDAAAGVLSRPRFVVNLPAVEGDLERLEEKEARSVLADGATWIRPHAPIESVVRGQYAAAEVTGGLLWVLAALLATEMFLAWRFGRRRQ